MVAWLVESLSLLLLSKVPPQGLIFNLPSKWRGGVRGGVVAIIIIVIIPIKGVTLPTDGGGRFDGRFHGTPVGINLPTNGSGRLDVRCRRDWGSSSTCYGWPGRLWARSP